MPKFYYKARNPEGQIIEGALSAQNEWLARKFLLKDELTVLNLNRFSLKGILSQFSGLKNKIFNPVSLEDRLVLMSQLETGISVGIPLLQLLQLLQRDLLNPFVKAALKQIYQNISEGSSLHESFRQHPLLFNPTVVGLVKVGEVSGRLDEALARISTMIEQQAKNQAKVKSAIFYPKIVVFFLTTVFLIAVYFLIPKLKAFLAGYGADLPPITLFVIGISDAFIHQWHWVLVTGITAYLGVKQLLADPKRRLRFDRFKLQIPVVGSLLLFLQLNHFCIILKLLIQSGVPLLDALEILQSTQTNQAFKLSMNRMIAEISAGGKMSDSMDDDTVFPATFRSMLSVAEESGSLEPILDRTGRYYQVQIDYRLDNLSKLIEPILLTVIFAMVLVLALALLLPIWKLNKTILNH